MYKRAVILAGGKGTRLRPYTVVLPKPLMPIGNYPIIEVIVRQLVSYGFNHITMAVNYQSDIIKAFFANGEKWGIKIDYSLEDKPLSTMAPLKLIEELPENFLVMNGDILTDFDFGQFYDFHCGNKNIFTIASYKREQKIDYGVLQTNAENKLIGFSEKPSSFYDVSMGIYMANRAILDIIPDGQSYGFDNLVLDLIQRQNPPTTKMFDGYWLDIGRPDDYMKAIDEFDSNKNKFLNTGEL